VLIIYASRTGNVKRFIDKLDMNTKAIGDIDVVDEPFVLLTYTDRFGEVPKAVSDFLDKHHEYLVGVSASGNRNWGADLFARSADKVSQKYGVPIISKFEMSGGKGDVKNFIEGVLNLCQSGLN
jgi:protein involved in ribonucleotide reduction